MEIEPRHKDGIPMGSRSVHADIHGYPASITVDTPDLRFLSYFSYEETERQCKAAVLAALDRVERLDDGTFPMVRADKLRATISAIRKEYQ
jgi:hypothetical protein